MPKLRMNQAVRAALADEMRADERVVILGEDVALAGGIFKCSEGLMEEFGEARVRDTPISEMGFLGAALGAAVTGLRPVAEIMFMEFLGVALDQVVTEAAKMHYLSNGATTVPMVVRASTGTGAGFGCQHSQTLETWLMGAPGLKVCVASSPSTAYGLVRSAIRDDNPVVVLEPRILYNVREDFEPDDDAIIPLGTARVLSEGTDVTVVALGQTVGIAREAVANAPFSADLIDLCSVSPWDKQTVLDSVRKTGRLVLVEESPYSSGWGGHVAAYVAAQGFGDLRAPVHRVTSPDVHIPFPIALEREYVPSSSYVTEQINALIATARNPAPWWEESAS